MRPWVTILILLTAPAALCERASVSKADDLPAPVWRQKSPQPSRPEPPLLPSTLTNPGPADPRLPTPLPTPGPAAPPQCHRRSAPQVSGGTSPGHASEKDEGGMLS